jgi:hypothetical protein
MVSATALRSLVKLEEDRLPRVSSYGYRNEVSRVISSQDFHKNVPALSTSYRTWKALHGFPVSIGILKRDLLQNLTVMRMGRGVYYSGVDPTANDEGRKNWYLNGASKRIITYAIWLEEGRGPTKTGGPQPPRPIFIPTANWFADNVWLKNNEVVINIMKRLW